MAEPLRNQVQGMVIGGAVVIAICGIIFLMSRRPTPEPPAQRALFYPALQRGVPPPKIDSTRDQLDAIQRTVDQIRFEQVTR